MVSKEFSAVAVLIADLDRVERVLEESYASVEEEVSSGTPPSDPKSLAFLAVTLSQYYNALEDLLERTARAFEGTPSTGESWHAELLRRASLDLTGLRPALLPTPLLADAFTLLKFRHFLRHVYAVKLDGGKLSTVTDALARFHPEVLVALARFRGFLEALLQGPA